MTKAYQAESASPAANGWGCESAVSTSTYVDAVAVDADGTISVTASMAADLPADMRGTVLRLVPLDAAGAALTFTPQTVVAGFACPPATMPAKHLPGNCRG